jgi:chaperonin GroEL
MLYVKSKTKDIVGSDKTLEHTVADTLGQMANIVGKTLGPGGRPVLIEREGLPPLVTKDGVTVVKALGLSTAAANIVLDTCKEISLNTARDAGDGTTTAIVLADALVKHGKEFMKANPKYNPQRFIRELQKNYTEVIIPYLKSSSVSVKTEAELTQVALISANGDKDVADVVVKAVMSAGEDGTVLIQEDQGGGMRLETIDGYIVTTGLRDMGSIGAAFINDRAGQQVRMDEGLVVLFDGTMNDLVLPMAIQSAFEANQECYGKPILVMAHGFADPVIEKFLKTSKSGVTVLPVKVPKSSLANSKTMFLQDMSAYTGASVLDPASAPNFLADHFGRFKAAKVNMYECFIQSESDAEKIDSRVEELKAIAAAAHSEHDRAHLRASIGKLTGGISTVWVGGMTDAEVRERKDRVQDAVEAVRSAIAEGIVAGGCATHLAIANMLTKQNNISGPVDVMIKALNAPFSLLLSNCGEADRIEELKQTILDSMSSNGIPDVVFDADSHLVVSAFESGIVEPSKVHRIAIGNAISVASLMVTLGGIVCAPRDSNLETQLELSRSAFKDLINDTEAMQE